MKYITDKMSDGELAVMATNFKTESAANLVALNLDAADKLAIEGAVDDFVASLNAAVAAKISAEAAVAAKDDQRATTRALLNNYAKQFRADLSISDSLLANLGVAPHTPPRPGTHPVMPSNLLAEADGLGNINLTWKRNGNIQGTAFVVEYQDSPSGTWTYLASVTKASFKTSWPVGTYVAYRVTAVRRGINSPCCAPAVLWNSEPPVALQVAA